MTVAATALLFAGAAVYGLVMGSLDAAGKWLFTPR